MPDSCWDSSATDPSRESATTSFKAPTTWPPKGLTEQSVLTFDEAFSLVADGAVYFRGFSKSAHHAVNRDAHFFPLLGLSNGQRILEASPPTETLTDWASFSFDEDIDSPKPWNTLEQPSMALCFGRYAGTMTFNRYIASMNRPVAQIDYSSKVLLRKIDLSQIIERLRYLQDSREVVFVETEQEEAFLYGQLLLDPHMESTNGTLERDIAVLSTLLNTPVWIDFSDPRKQFVAMYHADEALDAPADLFFHQILLSMELDRRISSYPVCNGHGTEHLMLALPRRVAWGMALSRRFFQNFAFEELDSAVPSSGNHHSLVPQNKIAQLERVLNAGYALEWPGMDQMEARMIVECESKAIRCCWSAPSATFLCGAVLPGPGASWMVLSCLLDCNPTYRSVLAGLEAMHPQSGFQYRDNTYWYWESIVGKVLGAMQGSRCVAGWIGPCVYTTDLERVEYVRIHQKREPKRMKKRDLRSIAARSDPLGTMDSSCPVSNFLIAVPNYNNTVDTVRVEKLALMTHTDPSGSPATDVVEHRVAVQFAINGSSYPIRLRYNVSFLAAAACWAGPHVLFYDYTYKAVRVDKLIGNLEWAGISARYDASAAVSSERPDAQDDDTVLVVEAYGAADNAVLARAW